MQRQAKSILIVEDDADVRGALTAVLESEGYSVVEAAHGQEALQHLRANAAGFCMILLDLDAGHERVGVPRGAVEGPDARGGPRHRRHRRPRRGEERHRPGRGRMPDEAARDGAPSPAGRTLLLTMTMPKQARGRSGERDHLLDP